MKLKTLITLILIFLAPAVFAQGTDTLLFSNINNRLGYMKDVALYKAQHHKQIEDIAREAVVIEKAQAQAKKLGLNPSSVKPFFVAQISAAKAIQYRYRADWLSSPNKLNAKPLNLKTQVRPALITLGNTILAEMKDHLEKFGPFNPSERAKFIRHITVANLTIADKDMLYDGLMKVRLAKK
ncbi:chorismate mutase [Vibrio marisflavi]|uniref:chorismate mutase n=1 Tax=Vibrio marisflavi CECT 7928 TaxID=634439 RepID=A0ABN8DZ28_9VIBR|nr:chorismate mutase [Vibrio marisflavi]CAH0536977.1 Secreted chorismate mutase [Vibrio marisflavi CECT 7928]